MIYKTRKIISPPDLNAANTLFGGRALAWIDEEAAIFAICESHYKKIVTKYMSEVDFHNPAHLGEIIEIGTELVAYGRTSITVACKIRNMSTQQDIVSVNKIVFVCLDEAGIPTPHGRIFKTPK
jgi:acyl-CoA thioesterase YciA